MQEIQDVIAQTTGAIIFLGPHGLGRWQVPEIEACIAQNVERKIPVIPLLLPGLQEDATDVILFLKGFLRIDLRKGLSQPELERLAQAVRLLPPDPFPSHPPLTPAAAPSLHNLPLSPLGDLFKGREDELRRLIVNLNTSAQATALTQAQAISGLGGIGKTRLAVEYAWRSGDQYDAIFFVVADSPSALQSGLADLASPGLLNLPEFDPRKDLLNREKWLAVSGEELEIYESVGAVIRWLREHTNWLLILDNVDTEDSAKAVREILPKLTNGHVILTSRRREWPPTVRKQPIGELSSEEATQFLLQCTEGERRRAEDQVEQARRLAMTLGGLPLALQQAAAYIVHHQITFREYLKEWEREREEVLEWHDDSIMEYPFSVATTWQTTFRQLRPKAASILRLAAFLAPDPIPESMFEKSTALVEEATKAFRKETRQPPTAESVREALAKLASYSMITR